jgi:hypothetical protein
MRRAALALTIILALPLTAAASDCVEANVEWVELDGGYLSPLWHPTNVVDGIRTAIEGHFLLVHYGESPDTDTMEGVVSVDLTPDVVGASVCGDGLVTLDRTPIVEGGESWELPPVVVDLEELWGWWDPAIRLRLGAW